MEHQHFATLDQSRVPAAFENRAKTIANQHVCKLGSAVPRRSLGSPSVGSRSSWFKNRNKIMEKSTFATLVPSRVPAAFENRCKTIQKQHVCKIGSESSLKQVEPSPINQCKINNSHFEKFQASKQMIKKAYKTCGKSTISISHGVMDELLRSRASVFAAQAPCESDFSISTR